MDRRLIVKAHDKDVGDTLEIYEFDLADKICYEIEMKTDAENYSIVLEESKAALLFSGLAMVFEQEEYIQDDDFEDYSNEPTLKKDFWEHLRKNDLKYFKEDD
jgi:hypothetical protein